MIKVYIICTIIIISTLITNCTSYKQTQTKSENKQVSKSPKDTNKNTDSIELGDGPDYGKGTQNIDLTIEDIASANIKPGLTQANKDGSINGKRTKENIMETVKNNLAAVRYTYTKRLKYKTELQGKVTFKILILETGAVLNCSVLSSTTNDSELDNTLLNKIKRWDFGKIDIPGDTTELIYPFLFIK